MRPVYLPATLGELWTCLNDHPQALLFAGGTDVFVQLRAGKKEAATLVGLERITELREIRDDGGDIRIGAAVTHQDILRHPLIAAHLPVLNQAIATLGSPPVRAMGTLGGNLCTASPAGDTLPPLYVLAAQVEIAAPSGARLMPIKDFITGPGRTCLKPGEIVSAVCVPKPAGGYFHHFEKVGQRKSMACAVASLAALIKLSVSGIVEEARLAWGSVGPTVMTDRALDESLGGKKLSRETLSEAAERTRRVVAPIDDIRASADYRRAVSGNLLLRLCA